MALHLTESEFRGLGLAIDPADPTRAVPGTGIAPSLPDDTWDLDRLALYASSGLAEAARLDRESIQIGRKSTVQVFRSGRALAIARLKLRAQGRGHWARWQQEHGIKRTTAWEAVELFERAASEESVAKLTLGEAKKKYGITRPPRGAPAPTPDRRRPESSNPPEEDDRNDEDRVSDEGGDERSVELRPPEEDGLASPPRTVKEVLVTVCGLLIECERRRGEIDPVSIPLIAEIREIADRLRPEVAA